MAYLSGIVLLILLFVVLHRFTEISMQQKIGVTVILAALILAAYLFNQNNKNNRLHIENILLDYKQNKTIVCDGIDVNNSEFSYSSGTEVFIGLKQSKHYGRIISLDQCQ